MTGSDDEFVVTTAYDHVAIEDVPGVVEVVVHVQGGRSTDRQGHLEHDGVHPGASDVRRPRCRGTTMLVPARSWENQRQLWSYQPPPSQKSVPDQIVREYAEWYGNLTTMSSDFFAGEHLSRGLPRYVGATLRVVWQWVRDQMYAGVVAAGYNDLNARMSDSGAIQASTDYVRASLRTWPGSRNSRSTTCSATWNDTGTSSECPIRPTEEPV